MNTATPYITWVDTCPSTNSLLLAHESELPHGAVVATRTQTAGRGQRGNSWEAEPGRNLTFSILLRPSTIEASRAFELSMIVATAIAHSLQPLLPNDSVQVKWPNDIYVGDSKICGILIENAFCGKNIDRSIVGIGINVNQHRFVSDAPNPVSLHQLTNRDHDLEPLLQDVASRIMSDLADYEADPDPDTLSATYHNLLWRGTGKHDWLDCLSGEHLHAAIRTVALSGHITLDTEPPRTYAFKELQAII